MKPLQIPYSLFRTKSRTSPRNSRRRMVKMKIPSFLAVGFPRLSTKISLLLAVPLLLGPAGLVTAQTFTTLHSAARSSDARNSSRMPRARPPGKLKVAPHIVAGLVVTDLNNGVTPADLVNELVGTGVTISNVTYSGSMRAAGRFAGGTTIIGFDSGIVLSTGNVQTVAGDPPCSRGVEGPNNCHEVDGPDGTSNSTDFGLPGDPDLTALSGFPTFDAAILEFDFVPEFSTVQFQYVFSSDEFSDYANTAYNDVFAFFVNGVNCALVPGTNEHVSVNTINNGNSVGGDPTPHHPELFRDNVRPNVTINTQMDGLTVMLTCTANVTPGVPNHMKLAIADASDASFDSAVFLKAASLISGTTITTSLAGGGQAGPMIVVPQGTVVTDSATLSGANTNSAGGTVSYKVFSDLNCAVLLADAGTKTVTNGQVPDSDPVMFSSVGTFYWQASYSGDLLNNPSSTGCGEETVTVSPTPTPTPTPNPTPAPVITSPLTATATQDQLFVYQVTATGSPTSYTATPLPAGLTFDSAHGILGGAPTDPGTTQIQLTASNPGGTGMATLTLTVQPAPSSGPVITSGTSITARTGQAFSFDVFTIGGSATARLSATGLPPGLSADPVTGIISGTPTADGSFGVTLTVTDGALTTTSTLQLTFTSDPAIPVIISPREATLAAGQFFTYTIIAPGDPSEQTTFIRIGTLPSGLSFDPATGIISGTYNSHFQNGGALLGNVQLIATNSSGTATSTLAFFQQVSGTAKNISTRLAVGTSDNVLIGGIIVTGNAPKKVIVRAIGPSLTQYGVPGALQDPTLELHDHTGAMIDFNDNWMDSANEQAIIDSGLAPSNNLESAILTTLDPGNYTGIIRGNNGTTGAALVEVYDLGTASLDVTSNAQLGNISTRGLVQTGDNVMIGGFIVRGDMPATVIVRAIGPSLTAYGVPGALQDPTLELHDGTGAVIGSNDNWRDDPGAAQIQADNLAPSDPRESATIVTLAPGNYTAIVRGTNDTTGVALVEAFVLQ